MKRNVSVLITDLDDTLWDWVDIWYRPFSAMLDCVARKSGVSRAQLIRDFKQVFTRHGTSEYAFALQELPSLLEKHSPQDIPTVYQDAIDAYRSARQEALRLYPDVQETLDRIKDQGALIVGYTESFAFYTKYRIIKLGLDRTLAYLYSPADHELPDGLTPETLRRYPPEHYQLRRTRSSHTPKDRQKPSPEILLQIIRDIGATPDEVIYVGDKLFKDVAMAQRAGVTDVHAAYGEAHNRAEQYDLLKQVTHWSPQAVQQERETRLLPTYTLKHSFAELFDQFNFVPFLAHSSEDLPRVLQA